MSVLIEKIYYQQWKCFHGCLHDDWYCKKTIQFGILVFLETQEMNLRDNLPNSTCDILHIFMRTIFVLRKSSFPLLTLYFFFETFLPQAPVMFCETDIFSLTLQPCNPDFLNPANTGFQKNVSFECSAIVGSLPEKGL